MDLHLAVKPDSHDVMDFSPEAMRDLRLSVCAQSLEPILYAAKLEYFGHNMHVDYPERYDDAPSWVRERVRREAEEAIVGASEFNRREAERRAMLAFLESYDDAERLGLASDEDHSKRYLIEAAILRVRRFLMSEKPWQTLLSVYRHALTHGGGK